MRVYPVNPSERSALQGWSDVEARSRQGPWSRRRHRPPPAELRGPAPAAQDGRGGRPCHRVAVAPDGRGGDRRGQELRLPRAGDPDGGRVEEEGRRLDAHDQPPGATDPEGPSLPPRRDAAGVHGGAGQGAGQLHQPPPARRRLDPGGGDVSEPRGVRPARADPPLGRPDRRRDSVRPRLPPPAERLGRRRQRERQLPGEELPPLQGVLLLPGAAADVVGQHPRRQPRAVHHRPGPARGRGEPPARLRGRDLRRGAHARGGRRRAPRAEAHQRPGRVHADQALQRPLGQGPARLSPARRGQGPSRSAPGWRHASSSRASPTGRRGTAPPTAGSASR